MDFEIYKLYKPVKNKQNRIVTNYKKQLHKIDYVNKNIKI